MCAGWRPARLFYGKFHELAEAVGQFFVGGGVPRILVRSVEAPFAGEVGGRRRAGRQEAERSAAAHQIEGGNVGQVFGTDGTGKEERRAIGDEHFLLRE